MFIRDFHKREMTDVKLTIDPVKYPWAVVGPNSLRPDGVEAMYQTLRCAVHSVIHAEGAVARQMRVIHLKTGERYDYGGCLAVWSMRSQEYQDMEDKRDWLDGRVRFKHRVEAD